MRTKKMKLTAYKIAVVLPVQVGSAMYSKVPLAVQWPVSDPRNSPGTAQEKYAIVPTSNTVCGYSPVLEFDTLTSLSIPSVTQLLETGIK